MRVSFMVRIALVVLAVALVFAACGGSPGPAPSAAPSAFPSPTTIAAPTSYPTPVGPPAQAVIDTFIAAGWLDDGVTDRGGEATHALSKPGTPSAIIVGGDPVIGVVLSGPPDLAPTARDFLARFTHPDVLAFWDTQWPLLRSGFAAGDSDKMIRNVRIRIEHTRYLSKDGFSLSISRA